MTPTEILREVEDEMMESKGDLEEFLAIRTQGIADISAGLCSLVRENNIAEAEAEWIRLRDYFQLRIQSHIVTILTVELHEPDDPDFATEIIRDYKLMLFHFETMFGEINLQLDRLLQRENLPSPRNPYHIIYTGEPSSKIESTKNKSLKDRLSLKQKVILLQEIGFFELPAFKEAKTKNSIGRFLSLLLEQSEKNTTDHFRNLDVPKNKVSMDKDFVKTPENIKRVNEILMELNLVRK